MKILFFLILLSLCGCSLQHKEISGVLTYGIWDQDEGAVVCEVSGRGLKRIAKANELRPGFVREDWTRKILQIRPLLTHLGFLYYYLPESTSSDNSFRIEPGIYRKALGTSTDPGFFLSTPPLGNCTTGNEVGEFWAVSTNGDLVFISIMKAQVQVVSTNQVSFAYWDPANRTVFVIHQGTGACRRMFDGHESEAEARLSELDASRIFCLENDRYVIERDFEIGIYNGVTGRLKVWNKMPVTCSAYDAATKTLFFTTGNDHDGRFVYAWKPTYSNPKKLGFGVLNDTLMPCIAN